MASMEEFYDKELYEDKFATLVAARVNEIRSGAAQELDFQKADGAEYTPVEEALLFANKIAKAVCHFMEADSND